MIARMKRERWIEMKKMIGIFAGLILALGMSGVSFAHWSETLYINGTVATGEVDVEIIGWHVVEYEDKDVGEYHGELIDLDGDGDYDKLRLDLWNLYPSYWIEVWIQVHNNGSIPVHITDFDLYGTGDNTYLESFFDVWCTFDPDDNLPDFPPQLHPSESAWIVIGMHVKQTADADGDGYDETLPEQESMSYEGYAEFVQWNYSPGP